MPEKPEVQQIEKSAGHSLRGFGRKLINRKTMDSLDDEAAHGSFKRSLSPFDLVMVGVGAIIGTGIFVLTGQAAGANAGPAISISFIIAAFASALAGLSYAEMATMIPVAGSAYTYAYATLGELVSWLIGWNLILEYLVGAATVSVGWSAYVTNLFSHVLHVNVSKAVTESPVSWDDKTSSFSVTGAGINLPAIIIVAVVTTILVFGIRESARVNSVIVAIKVFVVLLFIFACIKDINNDNYTPFVPPNEGVFGKYGVSGVFQAASLVFFAFIGFDAVCTTAQEAKDPKRALPIGILGSLFICTALYIAVCFVMTGVVNYKLLINVAAPMAVVINQTGMVWLGVIVELGAIAGLTSVILVLLMAMPRIFYAMARDGLLPRFAAYIHPKFGTPTYTTIISGVLVAILGGILPIGVLGELTSVGTLLAFFFVHVGVIILRYTSPHMQRRFRVPGPAWFLPVIGAAACIVLLCTASTATLIRLAIWIAIGLVVYFAYGFRHSRVNNPWRYEDEAPVRHQELSKEETQVEKVECSAESK
ncbi:uncharacterized protein VTP21DRAFT_8462 [Calcarisporiella thermophila]|uniref:uncharacterized protein n=1 Tax=Calcarisporiella thermophila TaxID=911321 RepID=UPI003744A8AD